MFSNINFSRHSVILFCSITVASAILLAEVYTLAPDFQNRWINDYDLYVQWGIQQLTSTDPCLPQTINYYPLPSTLWVFIPLALMPRWFLLVFMFAPFIFVVLMLKKAGVSTWLYYPLLLQSGFGQLDGWLMVPLYWLLEDRTWLAGIGAVLVLFKPQIAIFTVLYMVVCWIIKKNWRNLSSFAITLVIVYLPTFLICPTWPLAMLDATGTRINETNMITRGSSVWSWIWHGSWTLVLFPVMALVSIALFLYCFIARQKRAQAVQCLGLLVMPVLYTSSSVTLIPTLKKHSQLVILTITSWVCVVIDTLAGGWGGAYAIIPIVVLVLLAIEPTTPPIPTTQTVLQNTTAVETINTLPRD